MGTSFLFIHGSWHGAWCWHRILPRMDAAGHSAAAVDLPGHGRSPATPAFVGLRHMVDAAEAALAPRGKTVVVAHSRNGIVASALAERVPDRVARTIYVASYMLPPGGRVLDVFPDRASLMPGNITVSRAGLWDALRPSAYRQALYADCTPDDVALASSLLVREPLRPALTRLRLTPGRYGRVPRSYVRLTQDRAVSLDLQDRLLAQTPVDGVESIDASHSAYFSQPDALAAALLRLAGR